MAGRQPLWWTSRLVAVMAILPVWPSYSRPAVQHEGRAQSGVVIISQICYSPSHRTSCMIEIRPLVHHLTHRTSFGVNHFDTNASNIHSNFTVDFEPVFVSRSFIPIFKIRDLKEDHRHEVNCDLAGAHYMH